MRTSIALLALLVMLPAAAAWPQGLPGNLSFEEGSGDQPQGWRTLGPGTFTWDSGVAHSGSRSVKISASGWTTGWISSQAGLNWVQPNTYAWVRLSAWMNTRNASGRNFLVIGWFSGDTWLSNTESSYVDCSAAGQWEQLSVLGLPPDGATSFRIELRSDNNSGETWFDDVTLESRQLSRRTARLGDASGDLEPYLAFVYDYPDDAFAPDAYQQIASKMRGAGNTGDALKIWQGLLDEANDQEAAINALIKIGQMMEDTKDWDGALRVFQHMLRTFKDDDTQVRALQLIGDVYEKKHDLQTAVDTYQRIITEHPSSEAEGLFRIGVADNAFGQFQQATSFLEAARDLIPSNECMADYMQPLRFQIAFNYYRLKDFDKAMAEARSFLHDYATNYNACFYAQHLISNSYEQMQDYPRAVEEYRKEVALVEKAGPPKDNDSLIFATSALEGLAQNSERVGDVAGAIQAYQRIVTTYPQSPHAVYAKKRLEALQGKQSPQPSP